MRHSYITFLLMLASILLLCGFQLFWLHQSWKEQYGLLQKEASRLFARSVVVVQDSILLDWVETQASNKNDSVQVSVLHYQKNTIEHRGPEHEGTRIITRGQKGTKKIRMGDTQVRVEMEGAGEHEWVPGLLQSVILKVQSRDSSGLLPFQEVDSSLFINRIATVFKDSLAVNLALLPFSITSSGQMVSSREPAIETATASSILPSNPRYRARLFDYRAYLLREISPQILFSILLLTLTLGAFILIYRNLRQQQQLAEMRSGLISNITHELKTPIATVSVAMEALENFNALNDPARTREYLNISRSELNRLSILVDKVLKMAAFEEQGLDLQPEPLDLRQLVEETLSYLKVHFEKTGADVQLFCEDGDFAAQADRIHLTNVVYNLIENALKYSEDAPRIELRLHNEPDTVQFSVKDYGEGIPAEYQSRIFDKFFRVPRGDEHDVKGYGLGLSYVAKVVEKHRGTIAVRSRLGEGAQFIITLPRIYNL